MITHYFVKQYVLDPFLLRNGCGCLADIFESVSLVVLLDLDFLVRQPHDKMFNEKLVVRFFMFLLIVHSLKVHINNIYKVHPKKYNRIIAHSGDRGLISVGKYFKLNG